jgi:Flp pilus assembly protein TadD
MESEARLMRSTGIRALALALLLFAPTGRAQDSVSPGLRLASEGRFAQALPLLEAEIQAAPMDPRPRLARGRGLLALGRWEEALTAGRDLVDLVPESDEARLLLGDCLLVRFQAQEAAREYARVRPEGPLGSLALLRRMQALQAAGRDGDALEAARQWEAAGKVPSDEVLGMTSVLETDPARAAAALALLAARSPEDETVRERLAVESALAARAPVVSEGAISSSVKSEIREIFGEPCIPVRINGGERRWMALDTGAEHPLLKIDTAKKLRLPVLGDATFEGWGYRGAQKTRYVLMDRLDAAGIPLRNVVGLVDRRSSEFSTNKAGTIGLAPFRGCLVLYDRRHGRFQLWPSGTPAKDLAPAASPAAPLLWFRGLPLVGVGVQGKGTFPFLLDTGAEFSLLDRQRCLALGIRINSGKYGNIRAWGVSGAFSSGIAEGVSLDVGGHHYDRRLVLVTDVPQRFPVPVYGILGRDLVRDFILLIDGPGCAVTFEPYDKK